jgi:uncharacterized protein (TIGR02145 family)
MNILERIFRRNEVNKNELIIGNQIWMTSNLKTTKFRNGDELQYIKSEEEWELAMVNKEPGYCFYDHDPENGESKGYLYNWYAINDKRGLAPIGWKIPNINDFEILIKYLTPNEEVFSLEGKNGLHKVFRSIDLREKLIIKSQWSGIYWNTDNEVNLFKAIPSGGRGMNGFNYGSVMAFWWCYNEFNEDGAYFFNINDCCVEIKSASKNSFFALRLLRE